VKWTSYLDAAPENFYAEQIVGSAPNNVWVRSWQQILRYDGKAFQLIPPAGEGLEFVSAIHTLGANDTWAVRGEPTGVKVLHFDGTTWEETLTVDGASIAYAQAAFAGGGSAPLWAAIGSGLYRRESDTWQQILIRPNGYSLIDLAVDGQDVWVLGQDAVLHLVGDELVPLGTYSGGLQHIALSETRVWHFYGSHARTLLR